MNVLVIANTQGCTLPLQSQQALFQGGDGIDRPASGIR